MLFFQPAAGEKFLGVFSPLEPPPLVTAHFQTRGGFQGCQLMSPFSAEMSSFSSPAIGQFRDQFVNRVLEFVCSSPLNLSVLGQFVRNDDLGTEMKIGNSHMLTYWSIASSREFRSRVCQKQNAKPGSIGAKQFTTKISENC